MSAVLSLADFGFSEPFRSYGATDAGFIYIISGAEKIKAGKSINPRARLNALQTASPFRLRLLKKWRVSSMCEAEEAVHWFLIHHRDRGEWFAPPSDLKKRLLAIRDLESLLRTGVDQARPPRCQVPPIPESFQPAGVWGMVGPRSIFHLLFRVGEGEIRSVCGKTLSPEFYWWAVTRKAAAPFSQIRQCDKCLPDHFPL